MRTKHLDLIKEIRNLQKQKAKLLIDIELANRQSIDVARSITEMNIRLKGFDSKFEIQKKKHEEDIAKLKIVKENLWKEISNKQSILKNLNLDEFNIKQSITLKQKEKKGFDERIEKLTPEYDKMIEKLNNIKKDYAEEEAEQLKVMAQSQKILTERKEELEKLDKEFVDLKAKIQKEIVSFGIRERDLKILENRFKKKYPNKII